jgi:pilus assembly protein CpaE
MEGKIGVVIVDDIKETRSNIKTLLQFDSRIEILGEGENGDEAIFLADKYAPDIILMDINMPVKDGIKATEEISVAFPEVCVIIISVQGEQEYLRKAMAAGAREFITKPFSGDDLVNTIIKTFELGGHPGQCVDTVRNMGYRNIVFRYSRPYIIENVT